MNSGIELTLRKEFAEKVSFDLVERQLNSHDISVIPSPILKSLKTIPDAVIRIESFEDIHNALRIAQEFKIYIVKYYLMRHWC